MPFDRSPAWYLASLAGLLLMTGCDPTPAEPLDPTWADAAPILRGECDNCHGYATAQTGGDFRFDFFDTASCGDAALAIPPSVILAGNPLATSHMATDLVPQSGATWPRMPPQPSPALPSWELDTLERWAGRPLPAPLPPANNHPPNLVISDYPTTAGGQLTFTAVLDDPDGDSAIGVIEANGLAYLMNRPGSFAVAFDSSTWPTGPTALKAVVCDGWVNQASNLRAVTIQH